MRQCEARCRLGTVSRLDICARLAQLAAKVNTLQGSDIYRINDRINTVKEWQRARILKYASETGRSKNKKGALWRPDLGGLVGCSLWGPNTRGVEPSGICIWNSSLLT